MKAKKVFVAMSGGVDSSTSAALLKEAGFDVYGIFMQGWQNPHFDCTWKEDRRDAARVAAHLDIPFRTLDFSREYYEKVVSYLTREYEMGRTPNPDVMCNKEIKFGLFYEWAKSEGADYVATGHYVKKENDTLFIAADKNKDQTYFLWTLTPEIVAHTLFPVGSLTKTEVRMHAERFGLPVAQKKDSQGICFVGEGNIADFLRTQIQTHSGDIRTRDGKKVGTHTGIELYTIGQRHGIGIPGGGTPYYVAAKEAATSTLIVAEANDPLLYKKEIKYAADSWLSGDAPAFPFRCEARIRYRAPLVPCVVTENTVLFDDPVRAAASGQSIVFYKDKQLLGGGIIQ